MSKRLPARKLASVCFRSRSSRRQRLAQHRIQLRRQRRRRRPARADQERFVALGQLGALGVGGERLRDRGRQVLAAAPDGARGDRVAAAHDADVGAHVPEVEQHVAGNGGVAGGQRDGREQRPVGHRRRVDRARVNPLRLRRPDQRRQVVAPRRHRHHRRALRPLRHHLVIEHDVFDGVDDLALQLVADDLVDLALVGERQLQQPHRQLIARRRQVRSHLARQLRQPFADRDHLPFQQRRFAGWHGGLHHAAQRVLAEAHLQEGELDREGSDVDTADSVGHDLAPTPRASTAIRRRPSPTRG